MKKLYRIFFWHGMQTRTDCYSKISTMCNWNSTLDAYIYVGSLDNFSIEYGERFMFIPSEDASYNVLGVTHHSNFGQC